MKIKIPTTTIIPKNILIFLVITMIAYYHFDLHNGLEKIFCETYFDYDSVKRPLSRCRNGVNGINTSCIGMPSGHAETITIFAALLYVYKFISLPICVTMILLFSAQRIVSNMHTFSQVCFGILLGALYVSIYSILNLSLYSFLLVGGIGLLLVILTVYKLDQKINGPIPHWVDAAMIPSIHSKQKSPFYSKVGSIYINAVVQNRTFVSWSQLEKYLDTIVEKFEKTGQNYDAVVGIKTGGAIISDYVSKKLGISNYKVKLSRSEYNCKKNPNHTINDIVQKRLFKNYGEYTICEGIDDNLAGKNVILIDELVSSGKTMAETYYYLQNTKKASNVYPVCIALEKKYNGELHIDHVMNDLVLIWPWGYDN